jgi:hypothetical protein
MNTTLDLDRDVLESVQAIANREHKALGTVLSELVRRGLSATPENEASGYRHGFRLLPKRGEAITSEHVRHLLEEEPD